MTKTINKKQKQKLKSFYYSPSKPSSFGGVQALKRTTKLKPELIKEWLTHQDSYTLHHPIRYKFPRRKIIVGGINQQWQADLIDVRSLKQYNDKIAYLLASVASDIFQIYT